MAGDRRSVMTSRVAKGQVHPDTFR